MIQNQIIPAWDAALEQGWHAVDKQAAVLPSGSFQTIVIVGMGGSGIAGHLLALISRRYRGRHLW